MLRTVAELRDRVPRPWTGSWTEPSVQPVQSGSSAARLRGIRAGSACGARGRSSHNPPVVGSSPTRPTPSKASANHLELRLRVGHRCCESNLSMRPCAASCVLTRLSVENTRPRRLVLCTLGPE
jgi:hypothetical protein